MDHGADGDGLTRLREAAAAVATLDATSSVDPMVHADRFEALHEALAAALADVDTPDAAPRSSTVDPHRT
ncbi:hypothetical protein [Actinomycetospora termitidis]|uniref:Uncharacterized protein n=1 Tax=Actinomycetospora termitidis TaxID=3053470 RepID=A0ABT7MCL3_9PSEU|nr:hypothetical protein [Actinomycetospora sp. Odt1-22]MDL5158388.1 hypothetical protein [Actinomycetospora sp. Odt1-22]